MPDDALERLSKKLNAGEQADSARRSRLFPKGDPAPAAWHDASKALPAVEDMSRKRRFSSFELLFIGSGIFFVLAVLIAALLFFSGQNTVSSKNVDVQVSGPSAIAAGDTLSLQVVVTNHNAVPISLADLIVEYPPGTRSDTDVSVSVPRTRISLGTINPGESVNRTVKAVLFGAAGIEAPVKTSVEYHVPSSNAVFVSETDYTTRISESPAAISVTSDTQVVSGQETTFTIALTSNSPQVLKDMLLVVTYPPGFALSSANPTPVSGSSVWSLGDIEPGGTRTITLNGVFTGEDGDARTLTFTAGTKKTNTDTEIAAPLATAESDVTVTKPFISASIALAGSVADQHTISRGATVSGQINWTNNLPVSVQNLSIEVKLAGQIIDQQSIHTQNGFYSSSKSSILWDKTTNSDFVNVAPGATGVLPFSFATLPVGSGNFKNPQLTFTVNVTADRATEGNVPGSVSSTATTKAVVATNLALGATLSRSSGPTQPKANTETVYTVSWNISNSANALANTAVTAALPNYVRFISAGAGVAQDVTFDKNQSIVTWNVGSLNAGENRTATFQIGLTPSVSQIGQSPTVISSQRASGFDRFVQDSVETTANPLTTASDPAGGNGTVMQ